MEKLTLTILTIGCLCTLTSECRVTSAAEISLSDKTMPLAPKIKEIQVEKVSALTGAESPSEMKSLYHVDVRRIQYVCHESDSRDR